MEKLNELDDLVLLVNSKNNPFDNYSTVNDKSILAIAKAFRALEQRAEAAEAKLEELAKHDQSAVAVLGQKLRGYEKPTFICHLLIDENNGEVEEGSELFAEPLTRPAPAADHVSVQEAWEACGGNPGIKATREELLEVLRLMDEAEDEVEAATPAADLAELVPDERTAINLPELVPDEIESASGSDFDDYYCDGFNACRAAILRNIEEASKK